MRKKDKIIYSISFIFDRFTQKILIVLLLAVVLSRCSSSRLYERNYAPHSLSNERKGIVNFAKQQIGDGYKYGAKGPNHFDCSGLVSYVYESEGINIAGSAAHIFSHGQQIDLNKALPGDLIFCRKGKNIFHVSIISEVFNDQVWVVHSTTSRGVIEEDLMSSRYWRPMIYKVISLSTLKR